MHRRVIVCAPFLGNLPTKYGKQKVQSTFSPVFDSKSCKRRARASHFNPHCCHTCGESRNDAILEFQEPFFQEPSFQDSSSRWLRLHLDPAFTLNQERGATMACFSANFAFVTETNVVSVQQAQNVVAAQQRAAGWILYLRWFRHGCFSLRQGSPTPVDAVCPDDAKCSRGFCPGKIHR